MHKIRTLTIYFYNHPFVRYLFVGGTTLLLDISLLVFFHDVLNLNLVIANTFAYWLSISFNFCLNRWWTFSSAENDKLSKHLTQYLVYLVGNYILNTMLVLLLSNFMFYPVAKMLAVLIQTCWTYPIYKHVIFK